ncbi:DUF397 domain-containing protein [Streptomyces bacillaris]|uniref:DUF397 domain-containing protein n=1 Tax=Streptomyces sp. ZEA17I TaxID=2202516 RepID=UPI000D6EBB5C|nr:DUF397 domain-containing protein [Streptomyces sp. ZEA17I]PWS40891.1 DUF397 domain-containing protein [Streptomyces sp. ZEA17I]
MSDRLAPPVSLAAEPLLWRRSSRSTGMNNCVETARLDHGPDSGRGSGGSRGSCGALLAVRDSKDVERPPLTFSATAWTTFVAGLEPPRSG